RPARRPTPTAGDETPPRPDLRTDRRRTGPPGRHDQEPPVADLQIAERTPGPGGERLMNKPTCNDVADLIDLYAAHECAPAQQKPVRAHLEGCADCRQALDESRRLQGLLDVHFRQEAALSRLGARLKAEARPARRPAPRLLPFHRFAAVAALLLVTFG